MSPPPAGRIDGRRGGRPNWPNEETHLAEQWGRSNRRFGSSLPAYLEPRWHRVRPDGPSISTECDRQLDPEHTELSDKPPDEDGRIAGAPTCTLCYGRRKREERACQRRDGGLAPRLRRRGRPAGGSAPPYSAAYGRAGILSEEWVA